MNCKPLVLCEDTGCSVIHQPVVLGHSLYSYQAGKEVHECMLKQEGHFYVCGSARQVPEDIYTAMKEAFGC